MATNDFVTHDFNEWLRFVKDNEYNLMNVNTRITPQKPRFFDLASAIYLNEKCNFTTFMLAPVVLYHNQSIVSKSVLVQNLDEFVAFSNNSPGDILLYSVAYFPKQNNDSDEWVIRYGWVA